MRLLEMNNINYPSDSKFIYIQKIHIQAMLPISLYDLQGFKPNMQYYTFYQKIYTYIQTPTTMSPKLNS